MRAAERCAVVSLAALLSTGAGGAAPSVTVTRDGGRLDVEAQATPLSDVLDAVARELGASVEYEGTPPRFPVTLTLRGRTPAEAVLSLLDGTGVDFAVQLDDSGQGVVRLLVQSGGPGTSRARAQPARPAPAQRAPVEVPTPPPGPEFAQPFDPGADAAEDTQEELPPGPLTAPTPRPGRPRPAPLLFPQPLLPEVPTPTPEPERD